jgi:hypothetical protein
VNGFGRTARWFQRSMTPGRVPGTRHQRARCPHTGSYRAGVLLGVLVALCALAVVIWLAAWLVPYAGN